MRLLPLIAAIILGTTALQAAPLMAAGQDTDGQTIYVAEATQAEENAEEPEYTDEESDDEDAYSDDEEDGNYDDDEELPIGTENTDDGESDDRP